MIFIARLLMNRRARRLALGPVRDRGPLKRALLAAGAAVAGFLTYTLLRPLLRRSGAGDEGAPETLAVAGSRKPGLAPRPDSDDPLERIESQVVARETRG